MWVVIIKASKTLRRVPGSDSPNFTTVTSSPGDESGANVPVEYFFLKKKKKKEEEI